MCFITIAQSAGQRNALSTQAILPLSRIADQSFAYTLNCKEDLMCKNGEIEMNQYSDQECMCDLGCQLNHESSSYEEDIFNVLGPLSAEQEESEMARPSMFHQQLESSSVIDPPYYNDYYQHQPMIMVSNKEDEDYQMPSKGYYEDYAASSALVVPLQDEYLPVDQKNTYHFLEYESPRMKPQMVHNNSPLVHDSEFSDLNSDENYNGSRKYSFPSEKTQSAETILNFYGEQQNEQVQQVEQTNEFSDSHDMEKKENLIMGRISNSNKKNVVKNLMSAFKRFISDLQTDSMCSSQDQFGDSVQVKPQNSKISNLRQPSSCGGYEMDIERERQIVIRIFNGSKPKPDSIDEMGKKFKRYISSKQFNHYTIRLLVQHPNYGDIFRYFIDSHALNWLNHSKVDDPEAHRVMIEFLQFAFEDISIIDKLKKHEKRKAIFQ